MSPLLAESCEVEEVACVVGETLAGLAEEDSGDINSLEFELGDLIGVGLPTVANPPLGWVGSLVWRELV